MKIDGECKLCGSKFEYARDIIEHILFDHKREDIKLIAVLNDAGGGAHES